VREAATAHLETALAAAGRRRSCGARPPAAALAYVGIAVAGGSAVARPRRACPGPNPKVRPPTRPVQPDLAERVCRLGHGWGFETCWKHATSYWEGAPTRLY